ncbi:hypothetical protein [Pseudoalteromonas sp.]|uniref:hypothetical protein n=1 Tax=Pseudoalteromonas sp. TaxID=53249 RepID=UPI003002B6BA
MKIKILIIGMIFEYIKEDNYRTHFMFILSLFLVSPITVFAVTLMITYFEE